MTGVSKTFPYRQIHILYILQRDFQLKIVLLWYVSWWRKDQYMEIQSALSKDFEKILCLHRNLWPHGKSEMCVVRNIKHYHQFLLIAEKLFWALPLASLGESSISDNVWLAFRHFWNWVFLSISRSTLNCSNAFYVYFETCSNKHQHWHQHQYWHRPWRHLHTSNKRPDKARQKAHNNLVPYILTLVHCIGYSPLAYL